MMDPFQMGLMTLAGAQNPELMSTMMASQGISPTAMGTGVPGTMMDGGLGALLQPQAVSPGMVPGASAPVAQPSGLAALSGVKAPEAPKPIMNAGVSGGQKAPEMMVKGSSGGSQAIDMMMRQLMGAGAGVPNLAALLKGVG